MAYRNSTQQFWQQTFSNALILTIVSTLMDTKWMGHCIWYALDHFDWTKISMCSMSLTRQMQCNINVPVFCCKRECTVHASHNNTYFSKEQYWDRHLKKIHHQIRFGLSRQDFPWFLVLLWKEESNILAFFFERERWEEKGAKSHWGFFFIVIHH